LLIKQISIHATHLNRASCEEWRKIKSMVKLLGRVILYFLPRRDSSSPLLWRSVISVACTMGSSGHLRGCQESPSVVRINFFKKTIHLPPKPEECWCELTDCEWENQRSEEDLILTSEIKLQFKLVQDLSQFEYFKRWKINCSRLDFA